MFFFVSSPISPSSVYSRPPYGFLKEVLDHSIRYVCPRTGSFVVDPHWCTDNQDHKASTHVLLVMLEKKKMMDMADTSLERQTTHRIVFGNLPLLYVRVVVYHTKRNKVERYVCHVSNGHEEHYNNV